MSADRVTEVSSQSWFGRIGGAIKGVLAGLLLFVVAFPFLFWNEGRAVKRYRTLKEGAGAVVSVVADAVDAAREGSLVHLAGRAVTESMLSDPVFGVAANALRLKRAVEMYQWKERSESRTRKKLGGGTETVTTYTYAREWSGSLASSSSFKEPAGHQNPSSMPYESTDQVAADATLGAFKLPGSLVGRINAFETLPVGGETPPPAALRGRAMVHDGGFYIGANPSDPQVGDTRVNFRVVRPTEVSVVARQTGDTLTPYATKAGGTVELLQTGIHGADEMFQKAQQSNTILTWALRAVGFLLMLAGLNLVFRPLSVLADVLPLLGNLVGAGTGLIAFLLAGMLSLVTIAVAWVVYRPVLGVALLAAAVALIVLIARKMSGARRAA